MMGQLVAKGHELTPHPDQADVLVVNTCSFIDPAKKESVDTILEMAEYKKIGRAQEADRRRLPGGALSRRYPQGHARSGRAHRHQRTGAASSRSAKAWSRPPNPLEPYLYHDLTPRVLSTPRHFAYIKIAEGCDHPCTFCVIPQYRGAFRSRRFESVISEATRLFPQGVREINLIGQDTTCYGEDFGLKDGLAHAAGAPGADRNAAAEKWIRFLYAYPNKVTQTPARHHRRARGAGEVHRHAAAARQRARAEAHEARRIGRHFPQADRAHPPHHSRRRDPHQLHRRLSRRDRGGFRRAVPVRARPRSSTAWASSPIPTKTPARSFALDGKVDGRTIQNRKRRLMAIQRKISRARNRALVGSEVAGAGGRPLAARPICCGKRAWRRRRRRSTASR